MMGALGARRGLEWLLGLYFLSHVPITLLLDLQVVLPRELYPVEVRATVSPVRQSSRLGPLRALCLYAGVPKSSPPPSELPRTPGSGSAPPFPPALLGPYTAPAPSYRSTRRLAWGFPCPRPLPQAAWCRHFGPFEDPPPLGL